MIIHARFKREQPLTLLHLFIFQVNVAASNNLLLDWDVDGISISVSSEQRKMFCFVTVKLKVNWEDDLLKV